MGSIKDLASMIPGVGKALKDADIDDNAFKSVEAMIDSMTPYERAHPECINLSRKQRIAKGSGVSLDEINRITKQFEQMRKMMHMITNPTAMKQLQRMKGMPKLPNF
jgi:signal recognition particle subunit SRP54